MKIEHTTIVKALDAFLLHMRAEGRKYSTISTYRRCILHMVEMMEFKNFNDITSEDLNEYFSELRLEHNPGGVWVYYRPIKAFLRWYWDELDVDERNPIEKIKLQEVKTKAKKGIPLADFEKLIEVCSVSGRVRDKAIFECLLDSGCRATEFCALNINDADLLTGQVWIKSGKGDRPRIVRFGDKARRSLKKYLKTRTITGNDAVFPLFSLDDGGRFNRFSLRELVSRRSVDAGVPCPGLHDFRRLCGYLMHKNGASVREIQIYLGHSSMVVTQRYIALDDDDIMEAHRRASPVDNWRL